MMSLEMMVILDWRDGPRLFLLADSDAHDWWADTLCELTAADETDYYACLLTQLPHGSTSSVAQTNAGHLRGKHPHLTLTRSCDLVDSLEATAHRTMPRALIILRSDNEIVAEIPVQPNSSHHAQASTLLSHYAQTHHLEPP